MRMFSMQEADKLITLLGERKQLLSAYLALTNQQADILTAEDTDAFNENLDQRQKIIDKIEGLHQEIVPLMQAYTSSVGDSKQPSSYATKINEIESQTQAMLADVRTVDRRALEKAKEKAAFFGAEIKRVNLSRKSIGKYQNNAGMPTSGIFDQKQ